MRHKILTQYLTDKEMDLKYDEIKPLMLLSTSVKRLMNIRIFCSGNIKYTIETGRKCTIKPHEPNEEIEMLEEVWIEKIIIENYINNATLIYVNEEKQNEVNKERNREYDY